MAEWTDNQADSWNHDNASLEPIATDSKHEVLWRYNLSWVILQDIMHDYRPNMPRTHGLHHATPMIITFILEL